MNRAARITTIYGGTGCGKSTYVKRALSGARRVVVFDPQGEYGPHCGGEVARSPVDLLKAMEQDWVGYRIAYQPDGMADMVEELDRVAKVLWDTQEIASGMAATLVIEEANIGYPNEKLPKGKRGVQRLVLQGRHVDVRLVAVSQRPANVNTDLRGNAGRVLIFRLAEYVDRQAIVKMFGPDYLVKIRGLRQFEYVEFFDGDLVAANDNFSI
jgi:hypothetical protein